MEQAIGKFKLLCNQTLTRVACTYSMKNNKRENVKPLDPRKSTMAQDDANICRWRMIHYNSVKHFFRFFFPWQNIFNAIRFFYPMV